ncbi:hypothetical protein [Microbacterium pumilum]|uniref:PLD phosphodiesterase domain-containing protein n=1 Tax=Microbacterium pumilum TaxID=344165 RepID=A0ABN2T134_9MICO
MTIVNQQVLTPADVTNQVNANGLDVLGVTVPALSMTWQSATPGAPDETTLRLTLDSTPVAPFTGIYEVVAAPVRYSGPSGDPITAAAGILALHPEAIHRLEALVRTRLGSLDRPIPVAMLIHGATPPAQPLMSWFRAGEPLPDAGDVSFHDRRGLIIDPIAVAALFADLLSWRNALSPVAYSAGTVSGAGGVGSIAALAGSVATRVHVVTPHGGAYRPRRSGPAAVDTALKVLDAAPAVLRPVAENGLADLAAGEHLGYPPLPAPAGGGTPPPIPILWGQAPGGTLDTVTWVPPAVPAGVTLARQFFRVVAVDLDWQVLGNRSLAPGDADVPGETDMPANAPLPAVRRTLANFAFLLDGNDVLGAMGAALAAWPAAADRIGLIVSPAIDTTLALPATAGSAAHWPAIPGTPAAPAGAAAAVAAYDPTAAASAPTANWRVPAAGQPQWDVIVTLPAGSVPVGTFVRVFSRTFQLIREIGADPSFVRGNGGSAVVQAAGATSVLLVNPFGFVQGDTPGSPMLSIDILLLAQDTSRRIASSVELPVGAAQVWTDNTATFGGTASPTVAALVAADGRSSIAPSKVFGIPELTPTTPAPADFTDWVRWLSNEGTWPRVGPRLPSQSRFETILALGAQLTAGQPYVWDAVLSGGRYTWETRSTAPEQGSPGNPAGPDAHISGVRVSGQLAYDLAFHALKRSQSIVPTSATALGWLMQTAGDNWDEPPADPAPAAAAPYLAGAMLETISAITDSPELSLLPVPSETDTVEALADSIEDALGLADGSLTFGFDNEPRLRHEIQREIATARRGQRDAMWSLARAINEAREYVLIESPMFLTTAHLGGATPDQNLVDLTALLKSRLSSNPLLKVMICIPRQPDFAPGKPPFVRAAYRDRKTALEDLISADRDRVAAFHPIGFPGRDAVGRSTIVLVDDAYAMIGTSHWRRRGMTFDGGCDVAATDRRLNDRGAGVTLARMRQALLAARLGVAAATTPANTSALWTRLAEPESAFDLLRDLLLQGGLGRCSPVYAGPADPSVIPETADVIDPNGLAGPSLMGLLGGLIPS